MKNWRTVHRWTGFLAAAFLTLIAVTGVFMQLQILWTIHNPQPAARQTTLTESELASMLETTAAAIEREVPGQAIASFSLQVDSDRPRAQIVLTGPNPRVLSLDARSGQPLSDEAKVDWFSLALRLHRGDIAGQKGYWIGLLCGVALLALGITGLVLYFQMFRQRVRAGHRRIFW